MAFSTKRDGVKITIELNESLSMEFEGGACYVYVDDVWIYLGFDIYSIIDIQTIINQIICSKKPSKLFGDLLELSRIKIKEGRKLETKALNTAIGIAKIIYSYYHDTPTKQANDK